MAGSIHLFKITGMLKPGNVKLKQNYIWDVIEIDWKEVNVTFNSNKINLPKSITIKFRDKFRIRHMIERTTTLSYHVKTRLQLVHNGFQQSSNRNCISQHRYFSRMNFNIRPECDFLFHNFCCALPKNTIDTEVTIWTVDGIHTYRKDRQDDPSSFT